jgi:hypothetical protein
MRVTAIALWCLLLLHADPVRAIVGDAPAADASIERNTVLVLSSNRQCTGAVLKQDLVLTAAHYVRPAGQARVVEPPYWSVPVARSVTHPQFDDFAPVSLRADADVALLKLARQLSGRFQPVAISWEAGEIFDRLVVAGYGVASLDDRISNPELRTATLVVDRRSGNLAFLKDKGERLATCKGDSGGPAFATRNGSPALVGIVRGGRCRDLSIVALLVPHRAWILEAAQSLGSPLGD